MDKTVTCYDLAASIDDAIRINMRRYMDAMHSRTASRVDVDNARERLERLEAVAELACYRRIKNDPEEIKLVECRDRYDRMMAVQHDMHAIYRHGVIADICRRGLRLMEAEDKLSKTHLVIGNNKRDTIYAADIIMLLDDYYNGVKIISATDAISKYTCRDNNGRLYIDYVDAGELVRRPNMFAI